MIARRRCMRGIAPPQPKSGDLELVLCRLPCGEGTGLLRRRIVLAFSTARSRSTCGWCRQAATDGLLEAGPVSRIGLFLVTGNRAIRETVGASRVVHVRSRCGVQSWCIASASPRCCGGWRTFGAYELLRCPRRGRKGAQRCRSAVTLRRVRGGFAIPAGGVGVLGTRAHAGGARGSAVLGSRGGYRRVGRACGVCVLASRWS